ncbi:MAG: ribonuclease HII [Elusimicrobia bacterium]|nr:ribonuclease HII [Elusimicrobiota bacterium]
MLSRARFDAGLLRAHRARVLVGVDEAGRGPLAGPVVVAAVRLRPDGLEGLALVRDSKLLSPRRRRECLGLIRAAAQAVAVAWSTPREIERDNILAATLAAMGRAAARASRGCDPSEVLVLVDGNRPIPALAWRQVAIPRADDLSLSVASASIVAKVTRDAWMGRLDRRYPGYGLAEHKGYATRRHLASLERLGASEAHRRTFEPVRQSMPPGAGAR